MHKDMCLKAYSHLATSVPGLVRASHREWKAGHTCAALSVLLLWEFQVRPSKCAQLYSHRSERKKPRMPGQISISCGQHGPGQEQR